MVLVLESRHKGSDILSIMSLMRDAESIRPGQWFGSLLCVTFIALSLLVGWQVGDPTCRINHYDINSWYVWTLPILFNFI